MQPCGHLLGMDLLYVMFSCVIVTFQDGVLSQVWYLTVFIHDLCLLSYFYLMHMYAKFDQNILCSSRVMSIFTKRPRMAKMMLGKPLLPFAFFLVLTMDGQIMESCDSPDWLI